MEKKQLTISYNVYTFDELSASDRALVDAAREATYTSYAPYSHFCVGAAVRLANDEVVTGSNQENAAYPAGTCAERTTMFYANARYPETAATVIAIAARGTDGAFTPFPISPCGVCRQVLVETQQRFGGKLRCLMCSDKEVVEVESVSLLLPFQFDADALN